MLFFRWVLFVSTFSMVGQAYELTGKLYEKESNRERLLYEWRRTEKTQGPRLRISGVFTSPDRKTVATEEASVNGDSLEFYRVEQKQLGTVGEVKVEGEKLVFSFTKDGKTETNTEDREENFVVSPTLTAYLAKHREAILKGDTVKIRYGVLDRKETIGFSLFKTEEKKVNGVDAVIVKMKPSSLLLSALVEPIYFTFRKSDFRTMELLGRVIPKRLVDGDWKDLDCDTVYQ